MVVVVVVVLVVVVVIVVVVVEKPKALAFIVQIKETIVDKKNLYISRLFLSCFIAGVD